MLESHFMPVIMYFLKPSLPSWKTSRHCTVLLHTCREAERAEQGKHPDESYLKGTFPLLHKQVIEESSMCSSLIVVIELVMDFLELSMSLLSNLSYHELTRLRASM